jgi:N-methylhydantoinase B
MSLTTMFERRIIPPYGLQGGEDGALFRVNLITADGRRKELPGKTNIRLRNGDRVILESSGGGGYGAPLENQT